MNKWSLLCLLFAFVSCKQQQAEDKLYKTGDPVIDKLSIEIARNPDDAELFFLRGEQFYNNELFDEAIGDLNTALTLDSLNADYYHLLSNALISPLFSQFVLRVYYPNTVVETEECDTIGSFQRVFHQEGN